MAWNSGTFSRVHDWTEDQGNGIKIRADRHDEEDDGFATGINTCLTKDGQNSPSADLPMATHKHTAVGNASARDQYSAVGQVQDQSFTWCGTAGGTKNALTLTPSPAITAYAAGQKFVFKSGSTQSDDVVTIAISGLTTKAIQSDGAALSATNYIAANKWYEITYEGTAFQLNKISSLDATLIALSGTLTAANKIPYATGVDTAGELDFKDEDNMSSNSATALASQQSIKAYVDAAITALPIKLLQTTTLSNQASFTYVIPSGYSKIVVEVMSLVLATDSETLQFNISTDGGSSYLTTGIYDWVLFRTSAANAVGDRESNATDTKIPTSVDLIGNSSNEQSYHKIELINPDSSSENKVVNYESQIDDPSALTVINFGKAKILTTTAVNALRLISSSGNLSTGTVKVWGYK